MVVIIMPAAGSCIGCIVVLLWDRRVPLSAFISTPDDD